MGKFFGDASARLVENSSESDDELIEKCRKKVAALLGEDKAVEFDSI